MEAANNDNIIKNNNNENKINVLRQTTQDKIILIKLLQRIKKLQIQIDVYRQEIEII